ncbi:MAG: hypothetical protein JSR99_08330 [Proteobacteria bacterium]|nr:hypothetical protein [Pseudomonadota bacterium]
MKKSDEGLNFITAFADVFGTKKLANEREKAERRAGKTKEQRAKQPAPKVPKSYRLSRHTLALLEAISTETRGTMTDVIERAVAELAEKLNVKVAK